jgi:hypothetical protein
MTERTKAALYWIGVAGVIGLAIAIIVGEQFLPGPGGPFGAGEQRQTGWVPNPDGVQKFLRELPEPTFTDAGPDAIREAKGVDTFLYRAGQKAHQALYGRPWIVERQGIGDCVSWGWAHGIYIAQCVDWETGRLANPPPFPSTEALYGGSRVEARGKPGNGKSPVGGYSDGSYGAAAARWSRQWGVVYREVYGPLDLTKYSSSRAKEWGAYGCGGKGDDGKLDLIAKKHPATNVALVKTWDEAAAAIESGFPIPVCSGQGFSSQRDDLGYSVAQGSWSHCMVFCAVRYQKNGSPVDALLCLNSWGPNWNSGPKWPSDQPDGSFWVKRSTVERMLSMEDSFAVGSVTGFGWRDLDNGAFIEPPPAPEPARPTTEAEIPSLAL